MVNTSGIVVGTEEEKAYILISRNAACESCGACHFGEATLNLQVTAINKLEARVGDRVELSMDNVNYFRASFFLYGIPLLAVVAGIFVGLFIFNKMNLEYGDVYAILLGFLFLAVSYLGITMNKEKFAANQKYMSVITAILSSNELPVVKYK